MSFLLCAASGDEGDKLHAARQQLPLLPVHVVARHARVHTPPHRTPHRSGAALPPRQPAAAPELNIGPLQLPQSNGSGSMSKAAESQPLKALSAIQYPEVRSLGQFDSSKAELQ